MPLAIELAESFAPEHLEIATRDPQAIASRITRAGAVFVGSELRNGLRRLRRGLQPRPANRGRRAPRVGPRPHNVPAEDVRGRHDRRGRRGAHAAPGGARRRRGLPHAPALGRGPEAAVSRAAEARRTTGETDVRVRVELDGTGTATVSTGVGFFDHMLTLLARHSLIDIEVEAAGDLETGSHHTVEDVGITLGQALSKALGDRAGHRALRLGPGADGRVPRAGGDRPLGAPVHGHRRAAAGRGDRRFRDRAARGVHAGAREPRRAHPAPPPDRARATPTTPSRPASRRSRAPSRSPWRATPGCRGSRRPRARCETPAWRCSTTR